MANDGDERLLYVSRVSRVAGAQLPSTMEDILIASCARNARLDIGGFLWSDGLFFTQVLEGPREALGAVFGSILRDDRHEAVQVRLHEAIEARRFSRWSMCGMTLSDLDENLLSTGETWRSLYDAPPQTILDRLGRLSHEYGELLNAQHRRITAAA